jgi:NAD(P)-dependent dehydrogenase (short-subunit alcohol dehydrogenase family)
MQSILVTGGTNGIGLEVTKLFLNHNYRVHVFGRNDSKLKDINDNNLFFHKVDLEDLKAINSACQSVNKLENNLGVDIVVNCAGVFFLKEIENITLSDYEKIFDINLRAPIFISKYFSNFMKKKKSGYIFNVGSSSCYNGGKLTSLYCASKHALLGFSRSISDELKQYGVRVCNISPSSTKTDMGKIPLASNQNYETFIDPKEVADTLFFISRFSGAMEIKEILLNRVNVQ